MSIKFCDNTSDFLHAVVNCSDIGSWFSVYWSQISVVLLFSVEQFLAHAGQEYTADCSMWHSEKYFSKLNVIGKIYFWNTS